MIDKGDPKGQKSISLVEPNLLALRLAYLVATAENSARFFRTTRKRLEKLAAKKETTDQTGNQNNATFQDKAPIKETYIDHTRYELEKLGFVLIRADKTYLVCVAEDLRKISLIDDDNVELYSLAEKELDAKVKDFIENKNKKMGNKENNKPITEDKQLILKDIWEKLVTHAKANINQSDLPALTYQELTSRLNYKVHRNGLASFLYSIECYCTDKELPKLNFLVVKAVLEYSKTTDRKGIDEFKNEVKEILKSVQNNELPESPDITYQKKDRFKKSKQLAIEEAFSELGA